MDRWIFLVWAPHGRRSEQLAKELGIKIFFIHYLKFQAPGYAPFKYILQTLKTWYVLFREQPSVVFVQSPPFVCALIVELYCRMAGGRFVIDHHSDSFSRRWGWAMPLQRYLARRAITNVVTNEHWAACVQSWGADVVTLPDPFVALPQGVDMPVSRLFNIVFVCTYAPDEPLDEVLEAATTLPHVHFYITGKPKNRPKSFFTSAPPNVTFTGFLPDTHYLGLLRSVQAVMALTTRNYTLQCGGCEAVSLGKPLITSDWHYLRGLFAKGTIYVPNTAAGIRTGVLAMQERHQELEREMLAFRQLSRQDWDRRFLQLRELVAAAQAPAARTVS